MTGTLETGPVGWLNWRRQRAGSAPGGAVEFALYSDAHLTGGNFQLGPYEVINAVGSSGPVGNAQLGLVLRVFDHLPDERTDYDWSKTDTGHYHGGGIADEIAALFALALGIRCRASGMIREFENDGDRFGRVWTGGFEKPFLAPPHGLGVLGMTSPTLLPTVSRTILLEDAVPILETYPQLVKSDAVALLRAARGYEEGLWVADGDPQLGWLRLIGAIEAAAVRWSKVEDDDPRAALEAAWPELLETIEQTGAVAEPLVTAIAPLAKSSKRFRDFLLAHLPPPPERRPQYGALDWEEMPNHLRAIYTARSKALHAGTPFPVPMIDPPRALGADDVPAECVGAPVSSRGAVWLPKDAPMHLHVFAYIAGEALKKWWRSLSPT